MIGIGHKFVQKTVVNEIFEVVGIYPGGQGNMKQTEYELICRNGFFRMSEEVMNLLFDSVFTQSVPSEPTIQNEKIEIPEYQSELLNEIEDIVIEDTTKKRAGRPKKY